MPQTEKTIEDISQWVIENRYAPYIGERMTDTEMFNLLCDKIKQYFSIREERAFKAGFKSGSGFDYEISEEHFNNYQKNNPMI